MYRSQFGYTPEACLPLVRPDEKVLLYRLQHLTCPRFPQLLRVLRLLVLQVRLSCLL